MSILKMPAFFKLNPLQVQAWPKLYQTKEDFEPFTKAIGRPPAMVKKKRQDILSEGK